jgi:hypothetical protein
MAGISGLSLSTPVPPIPLLGRQRWIARLSDSCAENIQTTNVLSFTFQPAQGAVHLIGVAPRQLSHGANSQQVEVLQGCWSNGAEISEATVLSGDDRVSCSNWITCFHM